MPITRADALAAVERSPAAAAARDRRGWVGLFTPDGQVQDPVGSSPHRGHAAIGRFFDTFIGPRDVAYLPDTDIVSGETVVRDGVLQAALGSIMLRVPIYIRYDLQRSGEEVKIAALTAFWELPSMVGQFLRGGVKGVPAGLQLSRALLTNQGLIGTLGFLNGFRGTGADGKRQFGRFLDDARIGDEVAVRRWLGKGARITSGDDTPLSTSDLLSRLSDSRPRKLIASGYHIAVALERDTGRDVLTAEVDSKPFAIRRIRYFSEQR
ncbi:ketosteroid isomerase family protein [Mycobacterium deserti]|uniref:Ketosteroid isomerase family protein n=1 Tax=Mycobacterium deserti TaxID=2978347 RepID=A0ABT2MM28_9MYCO|nr:ketosteroid isomerase family protein [Mycobacterium deserti]MCT7662026.1 ketosteroid isomerase family protein [Mycobacterium deserti]